MPIIIPDDLASYLETDEQTVGLVAKAELADQIVTELIYPAGPPSTVPARVKAITLEMAARAVRNPDGYSSETVDDYTYRRDAETRQAGVYLTAGERAELLGFVGIATGGAYTVSLSGPLEYP